MKRRNFLQNSFLLSACLSFPCSLSYAGNEQTKNKVGDVINKFEKRRTRLLGNTAGRDISPEIITNIKEDLYSNRAIANLILNRFTTEANERIRHSAHWFDHPHPGGRDKNGECDFAAIKLCRAYYLFRNSQVLEEESRQDIEEFFLTRNFKSIYGSENHELMFRVSRYLMSQVFPEKTFQAYEKQGKYFINEDAGWLKYFIRFRARRGWGEFDSSCYLTEDWGSLLTLFDYTEDSELKHLTEMMLDLLLADMSVDSLKGMVCGAQGRIYPPQSLDHANENTFLMQYLYFGMANTDQLPERGISVDTLTSSYRPKRILVDLALDRPFAYENFERKHLHNMSDIKPEHPISGSIRKYTYYTPRFVMGCVQYQDPYPEGSAKWYAFHEQHDWDLSFAGSTRARIFTHHPGNEGNEHNYWTGDLKCGCGHFFQYKTALLCLYDIPEHEPYQFIHAYLPKEEFDEIAEKNDIIFVRSDESYAALKLLGGHVWTTQGEWKDKEVISKGSKNAVVCEVGHVQDFGNFKNFCDVICNNQIQFDPQTMELSYFSKNAGKLTMNTSDMRMLNNREISFDYPTYNSPYMKSEWDSGLITIQKDQKELILDFRI